MSNINKQFFIKEEIFRKSRDKAKEVDNLLEYDFIGSNEESFLDEDLSFESLETFLNYKKKINTKNNLDNLNISKTSVFFQLELFKELNEIKFNYESNLTKNELLLLKKFVFEKPFKIVELDKNVGSGIISNELYNDITMESLSDNDVYEELNSDPLEDRIKSVKKELDELFEKKMISKRLHKAINILGVLGNFRILPKIHKETFSTRPIISYKRHFLNDLCFLLNFILRPYVLRTESYIKDSQNFIQKTKDIVIPVGYTIATADFTALYSNIDHEDCLSSLTEFFKDKLDSEHITIKGFHMILKLVLENNYFKFGNRFFKQKLGIAMGSICGPSIANLFVYIYEKKWLTIHKPLVYLRFIDDLFIILRNILDLESLKKAFGTLSLTIDVGEKVKYLDLLITRNKLTSYLDYSMYFKPTNTFSYLQISSNHPSYIFKNLIKSLLIRARRICSDYNKFIYFASTISKQLIERGYEKSLIDKTFFMVIKLDRNKLLLYKQKKPINFNETFIIRSNFENGIINTKKLAHRAFDNFKKQFPVYKNQKLMIINKMQNNLSSLFVHDFRIQNISKNFYKKCNNSKCKTCPYANNKEKIFLTEKFFLPLFSNSSCNSTFLIYFIFCSFCNTFYIGQTNNLKERMYNHIYDIKNFVAYSDNTTSVSTHFNLKHHDYKKHFSFFIYKTDVIDLTFRLYSESFLLNLCKNMKVRLMNDHIPIIKDFYPFNFNSIRVLNRER
jgi:hypothetical protein